jgi:putative NIF3 family GTP cyclohydrolase 1 type 2
MYDNVILTDADGCFLYWEHGFHMWMIDNGYTPVNRGFYEIHDTYDISVKDADALVKSFNESSSLRRLPPFKDAIKYIRMLHEDHGYVFHCISAVPNMFDTYVSRMENINNLFGKTAFEKLTLCDSSANKKALLAKYKDTECFWIEDLSKNAEMGLEYGLNCILVNHHYNENDIVDPRVKRVKNWKEIYELIVG